MKTWVLVGLLAVALAACGGSDRREARSNDSDLDGVRGFLNRAFDRADPGNAGGGLCGDGDLQGEVVGTVPGRIPACGIENAIRLQSVAGVELSQGALMTCETAKALKTWVNNGVRPAVGRRGGGVARLQVAAHYVCRTRNHQPGAKISEHGRGKAIDISAIHLEDGSEISVLDDWGRGKNGKALRQMHKAACGPFGTVLGPESDRWHKDHFHFDVARYGSGSYCR